MYKETTNATVTQSANHQLHTHECDKLTIIDAVARNSYVYHADGSVCKDGTRHNNDALVMNLCKAPSPSKWIEGEQVYRSPSIHFEGLGALHKFITKASLL
jgi:hypothetical protein